MVCGAPPLAEIGSSQGFNLAYRTMLGIYRNVPIVDEDHHTIADADLALYAAKAAGRDRVVTFDGGDRVRA